MHSIDLSKTYDHLALNDQVMLKIIIKIGRVSLSKSETPHFSLVNTIISQQLSSKAASTIGKRFDTKFGKDIDFILHSKQDL